MYNAIKKSGLQRELGDPIWTSGSNIANNAIWSWYGTGETIKYNNWATNPQVEVAAWPLMHLLVNGPPNFATLNVTLSVNVTYKYTYDIYLW